MTIIFTDTDFMTVRELETETGWPLDWTSTKGLSPYIKRLKGDVVGIEIGTCRAESTYLILDECQNVKKIYTIDPFESYEDWCGGIDQTTMDKFEAIAKENLSKFGDRVEMVKKSSVDALDTFEDGKADFVFIDGDHSYEATYNDLCNYYPKLRAGGLFSGHDYNLHEVKKAITDFREKFKVRIPIQMSINNVWFWYKA